MFGIDFSVLERERTVEVTATLPSDDELWKDAGLALAAPVEAEAKGTLMPSGQVLVAGTVQGQVDIQCRRCVTDLTVPFLVEFTAVFATDDEAESGDGEIRVIPAGAEVLDLLPMLREELLLNVPRYAVCRGDCAGLCTNCGTDLNKKSCECTVSERDPRWDSLRALTL